MIIAIAVVLFLLILSAVSAFWLSLLRQTVPHAGSADGFKRYLLAPPLLKRSETVPKSLPSF